MPSSPATRRVLAAVLALGAVGVGIVLLLHPLSALELLVFSVALGLVVAGGHEAWTSRRGGRRDVLVGLGLVVAGIAAAVQPVWTMRALVLVLAVVLIAEGCERLRRPHAPARIVTGTCLALLGGMALVWPDLSVFALGFLAGGRLVLVGLRSAAYAAGLAAHPVRPPRRWGLQARRVGYALAVGATAAATALTAYVAVTTPRPDGFYDTPRAVPTTPGELLRAEPFTRNVPDGARAWRILYSTTRTDGEPTVASALVAAPRGGAAHPVIAWGHGTTGYARQCAPSLFERALGQGGRAAFTGAIERGWAVVVTDYAGMGTEGVQPYLVGPGEAHAVLDAVRAARRLDDVDLSDQTVAWGHSQGGHAALWTAIEQQDYAPDVPLAGVAAVSPVSDPATFLRDLQTRPVGTIFVSYALAAYDGTYDDVAADDHVRAVARVPIDEIGDRCLHAQASRVSLREATVMADRFITRSLFDGNLGRRLNENAATGSIEAPVLIAQGEIDQVVTRRLQDTFVAQRCADGQSLDYRTYPGLGHGSIVAKGSPFVTELLDWTAGRFAGLPTTVTC